MRDGKANTAVFLERLFVPPEELAKRDEFRARLVAEIPLKTACIHSAVAPNMNLCIVCGMIWNGERWEDAAIAKATGETK